jgi:hypothetical protein
VVAVSLVSLDYPVIWNACSGKPAKPGAARKRADPPGCYASDAMARAISSFWMSLVPS